MRKAIQALLCDALRKLHDRGRLVSEPQDSSVAVDRPRSPEHGDWASGVALALARAEKKKPMEIAEAIAAAVEDREGLLKSVEIAPPGFVNFRIREDAWARALRHIDAKGERYALPDIGRGERVLVEFLSANPTGPLHVGHGRIAVVGDTIARILASAGYRVEREYYVNDVGKQMNDLGRSVEARYRELCGEPFDDEAVVYQGDYIKATAARAKEKVGRRYVDTRGQAEEFFLEFASNEILKEIRAEAEALGAGFDRWFSERVLHESNSVASVMHQLGERDLVEEIDGALYFRASKYGDRQDRVVRRADGTPTYFAGDLAYHMEKLGRGFAHYVNVVGSDHAPYMRERLLGALRALGGDVAKLRFIFVQFVNLIEDGKAVSMSTRAGKFVPIRQVLEEVGRDATRFFFLMRHPDSHLNFDLDLAKRRSNENPVYYVQYAHARISSVIREGAARQACVPRFEEIDPSNLALPAEREVARNLVEFPDVVERAAVLLEPHRIVFALQGLASAFHSYYNMGNEKAEYRILCPEDEPVRNARLFLAAAVRQVLAAGLGLLGVSAPEQM